MKKNVIAFINELAEKAGIEITNEHLVALQQKKELALIDLPDELVSAMDSSLISITDAKANHPEIKTHYFAEIMSNVDRQLKEIYDANTDVFDETTVAELNREKSSTKRIGKAIEKLKEKQQANANKNGDDKTKQLQQQIDDLNRQLASEKEGRATDKTTAEKSLRDYKVKNYMVSRLMAAKTVYDKLTPAAKENALRALVDQEIRENGLVLEIDDSDNVIIKKNDGSNYFDEKNKQVSPETFIDRTLAKHQVLQQSDEGGRENNNQQQDQNRNQRGGDQRNRNVPANVNADNGNDGGKQTGNIKSATQRSRESLRNNTTRQMLGGGDK